MRERTVISGTARMQDVIPALLVEVRSWVPRVVKTYGTWWSKRVYEGDLQEVIDRIPHGELVEDDGLTLVEDHPWWDSDDAVETMLRLIDALDEVSAPGMYFGAHPGDGTDLGWWKLDEDKDETPPVTAYSLLAVETVHVCDNNLAARKTRPSLTDRLTDMLAAGESVFAERTDLTAWKKGISIGSQVIICNNLKEEEE